MGLAYTEAGRLHCAQVTVWGSYTLMVAERRLLAAALSDPSNAWFVLVSDTTAPLYPPQLLWQQLAHETRSKMNTCWSEVRRHGRVF